MNDTPVSNPPVFPDGSVAALGRASWGQHLTQWNGSSGTLSVTHTLRAGFALVNSDDWSSAICAYQLVGGGGNLQAYSTADTANWDPTHPRFFSGTACTATATAAALSGILTHAQLCIGENGGDTVVKEYFDKSQAPSPLPSDNSINVGSGLATANLGAIFDSTHFVNASQCVLKVKVWDSNSGHYEAQLSAPVKNRLYGIANQNLAAITNVTNQAYDQLQDVVQTSNQMNDFSVGTHTDHVADVLNTLPSYTVFFAETHGLPSIFLSCYGTPTDSAEFVQSSNIATHQSVADAMRQKTANPNLPPYNFVQINACESGKNSDFSDAFNITSNSGYIISPDRACLEWSQTILADFQETSWTAALWEKLSEGQTLIDAEATTYCTNTVWAEGGNWYLPLVWAFPTIYGDMRLKLHGVYGGANASQWYKPL